MKSHSLLCKPIIYFAIFSSVVSATCNPILTVQLTPTVALTSTPEKLELVNGELDACQLIDLTDVEAVLSMKVVRERIFVYHAPSCKYVSMIDDSVLFLITATTDATIKRANGPKKYNSTQFVSAVELYEMNKMASLNLSEFLKVEDIENFGDQAFLVEGTFLEFNILKDKIYYVFNTRTNGGISYEALMKLAQIAFQRMP